MTGDTTGVYSERPDACVVDLGAYCEKSEGVGEVDRGATPHACTFPSKMKTAELPAATGPSGLVDGGAGTVNAGAPDGVPAGSVSDGAKSVTATGVTGTVTRGGAGFTGIAATAASAPDSVSAPICHSRATTVNRLTLSRQVGRDRGNAQTNTNTTTNRERERETEGREGERERGREGEREASDRYHLLKV